MARMGVLVSRTVEDDAAIHAALHGVTREEPPVVIAAHQSVLDWAAGEGLAHEEVPAGKVVALSDTLVAITAGPDEEVDSFVRRATIEGKRVDAVDVGGDQPGAEAPAEEGAPGPAVTPPRSR